MKYDYTPATSSRKRQLRKLAPCRKDYEEYVDKVNQISAAVEKLVNVCTQEQREHEALVQELVNKAIDKLAAEEERIIGKVQDDYNRLIAPLDEHKESLIRERDALIDEVHKGLEEPILVHVERLRQLTKDQGKIIQKIKDKGISALKEAEHQAYEDLKLKTTTRKFGRGSSQVI